MNHLDEGTIHAWLDGALDASQARDIESHVAQCPACRDAVLEARGLVAGASRILTALDDVPAGVTPKPSVAPKRQWLASPWVTGIAAALVLAVGLTTWTRTRASFGIQTDKASEGVAAAVREEVGQPASAQAVTDSAAGPTIPGAAALAPQVASREAQKAPTRAARGADEQLRAKRSTIPPSASASGAETAAEPKLEKVVTTSVGAAPVQSRELRLDEAVGANRAASPSPAPSITSIPRVPLASVSDVERSAGCYHFPVSPVEQIARDVKVAADRGRASAPSAAASSAGYVGELARPALLRLDTNATRIGFIVRSAPADAEIGTWRPMIGDSVRVDLRVSGSGTFVLPTKARVGCPQSR